MEGRTVGRTEERKEEGDTGRKMRKEGRKMRKEGRKVCVSDY